MPTIISYFGFLLVALTITSALFIGLSKIRLIWFEIRKWIGNFLNEQFIKRNLSGVFHIFYIMSISNSCEIHVSILLIFQDRYYPPFFIYSFKEIKMIEVFLFGIVLGLIPITLAGLFVTAYLQYRRGDQLELWLINIISLLFIDLLFVLILIHRRSKFRLLTASI